MSLRARSPAPSPLLPQAQESRSPAPPSSRPRDPGPIVFLPQDLGFWAPIPPPRIQGPESPTPSSPRPKRPSRLPLNPRILWATLWRPPVREAGGAEGAQEPRAASALSGAATAAVQSGAGPRRGSGREPGSDVTRHLPCSGRGRVAELQGPRREYGGGGDEPVARWVAAAAAAAAPRAGKGQEPVALEGCGLQGSNPAQAFWVSAFLSELRQWNK